MTITYSDVSAEYSWGDLIPLPPNSKRMKTPGFTGRDGKPVTGAEKALWAGHQGNYALRVPECVVGIDVDTYLSIAEDGKIQSKDGAGQLAELEEAYGPLPPTWISTGRGNPFESGIRFFRLPPSAGPVTLSRLDANSIDLIRRTHRYAAVWPSVVKDDKGSREYLWYGPDGGVEASPPDLEELAELPAAWVSLLTSPLEETAERAALELEEDHVDPVYARRYCDELFRSFRAEMEEVARWPEGYHRPEDDAGWDLMVAHAAKRALRFTVTPHSGYCSRADAHALFCAIVPAEIQAAVNMAEKWAGESGPKGRYIIEGSYDVRSPAQRAQEDFGPEKEYAESLPLEPRADPEWPARWDPGVSAPDALGRAAIAAASGMWRYCAEERMWYEHRGGRWSPRAGDAPLAVAKSVLYRLSQTMPKGDPSDKEDPRHKARSMCSSPAGRSVVGQAMVDILGTEGLSSDDMAEDPSQLWAGGYCWSLRDSLSGPVVAQNVDLNTIHLGACAVLPLAECPTPRWSQLLEAVFPDREVREYFLRACGVALTGHSERLMVAMYGETSLGKSTMLRVLDELYGSYATRINSAVLSGDTDTRFARMRARGKRLVWVDEGHGPSAGEGTERLKEFTGGAPLSAEFKGGAEVVFKPTHTLMYSDNKEPAVRDAALRVRTAPVIFEGDPEKVAQAAGVVLPDLMSFIRDEGPGILAGLMRMAAAYLSDRRMALRVPARMEALLDDLAVEQNPVARWARECTTGPEAPWSKSGDLWDIFVLWRGGHYTNPKVGPQSDRALGMELTRLGIPQERRRDGSWRQIMPRGD